MRATARAERTFEAMTGWHPDDTLATLLYDPVISSAQAAERLMSVVSGMIGQTAIGRARAIPTDELGTCPSTVKAAGVPAASSIVGGSLARTRHRP
jgi:hypothetical protein